MRRKTLRFTYSSMTTPWETYDYNLRHPRTGPTQAFKLILGHDSRICDAPAVRGCRGRKTSSHLAVLSCGTQLMDLRFCCFTATALRLSRASYVFHPSAQLADAASSVRSPCSGGPDKGCTGTLMGNSAKSR